MRKLIIPVCNLYINSNYYYLRALPAVEKNFTNQRFKSAF